MAPASAPRRAAPRPIFTATPAISSSTMLSTYSRAGRAAAGLTGQLVLGTNDLSERTPAVTRAIARFVREQSGINLDVRSMTSDAQLGALRDRRIDAGLMIERATGGDEFDHHTVAHDPFVLALRHDQPLASNPVLELAQLADVPFITLSLKRYWLAQGRLLARLQALAFQPLVGMEVESERLQLSLVAEGLGVALVNASAAFTCPACVVFRQVNGLDVQLTLDLVWPRKANDSVLDRLIASFSVLTA